MNEGDDSDESDSGQKAFVADSLVDFRQGDNGGANIFCEIIPEEGGFNE